MREAFRRAAYAATQAWNRSLQGAIQLVGHTGSNLPDIRVRAVNSPVDGGNLGVTCFAPFRHCAPDHPNLADIQVA